MLDTRYDFKAIESRLTSEWEKAGCFDAVLDGRKPFAIMMPPPNVTGTLHLGHALDNTLPDILIRRARMQGLAALYQPGTDHASIAVHVVLERQWAKEGKNRFDYGREKFLEKAWEWKDYSAGIITTQLRRLGISCDWKHERFTMDPAYAAAVNEAFVTLHQKGLIYRGQRLVNWDPKMQTAVSDLEVKHKEVNGHLWHVRYKFADGFKYKGEDGIEIATTRPETILADAAIAINPKDKRAKDLVGKMVVVPVCNRQIPIIADEMADPEFGSGMVKVTPAHDFNDFAFYQRHKDEADIPLINLLTPDAHLNENAPAGYVGLERFAARKKMVAELEELGQLIKAEPHVHNVGHAERDDIILEPYLTWQWYVKTGPLAEKCLKAADNGDIEFINDRDEKIYRHWLENIQDWCISRQLWWGHRIPAWYRGNEVYVGTAAPQGEGWKQDEDILDTWFSSGLWPFATQGWPQGGERLQTFYPNSAITPGRDILFFWVIRMMMMGLELTGKAPFKTIYTHGLINDEHGQKMSKSKGNVLDPIGLMDEFGTDALRLTMATIASSEDMRFSTGKVEQSRNFCTKLWNAARYLALQDVRWLPEDEAKFDVQTIKHPINRWLVGRLAEMATSVDKHLDAYAFNQAAQEVYHFTWGTWCDWYLELTKPLLRDTDAAVVAETKNVLGWAFEKILRILHPFTPFITEELWQGHTVAEKNNYLMLQRWPVAANWPVDKAARVTIDRLVALTGAVRQARMMHKLSFKIPLNIFRKGEGALPAEWQEISAYLKPLAGVGEFAQRNNPPAAGEATLVVEGDEFILPLTGLIDLAAERERLQKELNNQQAELSKIDNLLGNAGFVAKAPPAVLEQNRDRQNVLRDSTNKIEALLKGPYAV
ncbi:MAG TPA: valine--tRNA ligase [Alphaproteobacteria bacterium]|nr:valine--tRNA ligase [Alphaproteobacteria bacterium]